MKTIQIALALFLQLAPSPWPVRWFMRAPKGPARANTSSSSPATTNIAARKPVRPLRILAKRYGFKCTVLFGLDENGHIKAGSSDVPGIEVLKDADMMFLFLRFLAPNDAWMKHFTAYLDRGGPVLGLRTTTHAFNGLTGKYALQLQFARREV